MTSRPSSLPLPKMAWLHSESLDLVRRLSQVGRARLPGPGRVEELKREIGLETVKGTAVTVTVKELELEAVKGTAETVTVKELIPGLYRAPKRGDDQ
jgi:hypothetical protein